jgi:hypothetical protein
MCAEMSWTNILKEALIEHDDRVRILRVTPQTIKRATAIAALAVAIMAAALQFVRRDPVLAPKTGTLASDISSDIPPQIPQLDFKAYPARPMAQNAARTTFDFSKPDLKPFRGYRSVVAYSTADGKPDAAGHYKLVELPCSIYCSSYWMADLASGRIYYTPAEKSGIYVSAFSRPDSRLIVFWGDTEIDGADCEYGYFEWLESERKFRLVKKGTVHASCDHGNSEGAD